MRLGTLRTARGSRAVRVDADRVVEIDGFADLGALLGADDWRGIAAEADGAAHPLDGLAPDAWETLVPSPPKVVCTGLNYRNHIIEMGRDLPEFPTLFAKYSDALIGAADPIRVPREAEATLDWEGELTIVIGREVRFATLEQAASAIAGYTVMNDVSVREHQKRTLQWLQGKTFEHSTPVGPWMVTADVFDAGAAITTTVDGDRVQHDSTGDLVFSPAELVAYISRIATLRPGDLVATGTPGGVGSGMTPPRFLRDGSVVEVAIDGIGTVRNVVEVFDPA